MMINLRLEEATIECYNETVRREYDYLKKLSVYAAGILVVLRFENNEPVRTLRLARLDELYETDRDCAIVRVCHVQSESTARRAIRDRLTKRIRLLEEIRH